MKRFGSLVTLLTSSMLVAGFTMDARAATVCVDITAEVEYVDDPSSILSGAIDVGDIVTGTYIYESSTPDSNPLPRVGDYWHTSAPYGITLNAGDLTFRTDPNNVNFLVEIVNSHGNPPSDNYLLRSYTNIFDVGSNSDNHISWQLDDPTLKALSSQALPTVPPVLPRWQSIFGLEIESWDDDTGGFFVRSHVTAATLSVCPQ